MTDSLRSASKLRFPFTLFIILIMTLGPMLAQDVSPNVVSDDSDQTAIEHTSDADQPDIVDDNIGSETADQPEGDDPTDANEIEEPAEVTEDDGVENTDLREGSDDAGEGDNGEFLPGDDDVESEQVSVSSTPTTSNEPFHEPAPWPSTNDINRVNDWPHINVVTAAACNQIRVEFVNPGTMAVSFEFRHANSSGMGPHPNTNPWIPEGEREYLSHQVAAGQSSIASFSGSEYSFRLAIGGDDNHNFDWITIPRQQCGTVNITINTDHPDRNVALPANTSWKITETNTDPDNEGESETVLKRGTIEGSLPISFAAEQTFHGNNTFTIENAGPLFETQTPDGESLLSQSFVLDDTSTSVELTLQLSPMGIWYPLQSTNEENIDLGYAHVTQLDSVCEEIALEFRDPMQGYAYFEVLVDGDPLNGHIGDAHPIVPDSQVYGGIEFSAASDPEVRTFDAMEVSVRFAIGEPGAGYFDWTTFQAEPCESDVTIEVSSLDSSIANVLPVDASWAVSFDGQVIAGDTFADDNLQLPAVITVDNRIPFGTYTLSIDAGPNFEPLVEHEFVVNQQVQAFSVALVPAETSDVTIEVSSLDSSIANVLPADASWTVSFDGQVIAGDTFAADHLQLPAEITVDNRVSFGTYTVSIDAGPNFEPLVDHELVVNQQVQSFSIELTPLAPVEETHTGIVQVVEADTSTPVVGATVSIFGNDDDVALYVSILGLQSAGGGVEWGTPLSTGVTDETGAVNFAGLPNDVYGVAVVTVDGRTATGTLTIADGDSTSLIVMQALPDPDAETPPAEEDEEDAPAKVTILPETGSGSSPGASIAILVVATVTVLAGTGGLLVRHKRS